MGQLEKNAQASVVAFLSRASSYPDEVTSVEVVETHISFVFLTDHHAYKLKKGVYFEFLDYSTPESRRQACQQELALNRRFTREVYIDVLPITRSKFGGFTIAGSGRAIDWIVKMKRLPAEKALNLILREHRLTAANADEIATYLAHLYSKLVACSLGQHKYGELLEKHIRANGATLVDSLPEERARLHRVQSAQLRLLHIQAELVANRILAGRVVDGHGDLRPEHIYLDSPLAIIDCVEFSDELRAVDIADELSFFAMECQRLGDRALGQLVLDTYRRFTGDVIPRTLLAFYQSYRACVRAKVAVLRSQQQTASEQEESIDLARQYIECADHYSACLGPPALIVVGGLMGSGKSTLASSLAQAIDAELLATDSIRRSMFGASKQPASYGEDHYRPELRDHVYQEMLREADKLLSNRETVVLDGTFLTKALRVRTYDLSHQHGAKCLYVQTTCPRPIAFARIQQRSISAQSESEARAELYDQQAEEFESISPSEPAISVDTTQPKAYQLRTVFGKLRELSFTDVV